MSNETKEPAGAADMLLASLGLGKRTRAEVQDLYSRPLSMRGDRVRFTMRD